MSSFLEANTEIKVDVEEQLCGDIVRAVLDGVADIRLDDAWATRRLFVATRRDDKLSAPARRLRDHLLPRPGPAA